MGVGSNLRLSNSKESKEICVICVILQTLIQNLLRFHELVLFTHIKYRNIHELNHSVGSSVVSLKELLVQANALQTILLCLTPHAETRVGHGTVGVKDVVTWIRFNSL